MLTLGCSNCYHSESFESDGAMFGEGYHVMHPWMCQATYLPTVFGRNTLLIRYIQIFCNTFSYLGKQSLRRYRSLASPETRPYVRLNYPLVAAAHLLSEAIGCWQLNRPHSECNPTGLVKA